MFDKLHRQLTIFCTATIGTILVVLSLLCLFYARQSIIQTDRSSFQKQLNTILTSLQSQEYISHQWLNQMQNEYRFSIYLYDNGEPLYANPRSIFSMIIPARVLIMKNFPCGKAATAIILPWDI